VGFTERRRGGGAIRGIKMPLTAGAVNSEILTKSNLVEIRD